MNAAQEALWGVVNETGPWWWYLRSGLCFVALMFMLRHQPEHGFWRNVAVYVMMLGMALLALSVLNSAFEPFGSEVFFTGFALTAYLRMRDHIRRGIARPVTRPPAVVIDRDWQQTPRQH